MTFNIWNKFLLISSVPYWLILLNFYFIDDIYGGQVKLVGGGGALALHLSPEQKIGQEAEKFAW